MNAVNWFEIAVSDLDRAKKFYESVFKTDLQYLEMGETKMYMFAGNPQDAGATGCIFKADSVQPSAAGSTVYFASEDVNNEVSRVEANGGTVIFPKTSIGEFGFIAQVMDTEGNRLGIHSEK